jgi:hypothetical protein
VRILDFASDIVMEPFHNAAMLHPDAANLDMFGRELYERRLGELTMFGAYSEDEAHEHAMRYARGLTPSVPVDLYPDDYTDVLPPS